MSDDLIPDIYTNPIASLDGLESEADTLDAICDILETLPFGIVIPSRDERGKGGSYAVGYSQGKMIRIEKGGGVMIHDINPDASMEEGYIYQTPSMAIAWLICKLGHGDNASNFESSVVVIDTEITDIPIRLAFEVPPSAARKRFYESMGTLGFNIKESGKSKGFGSCLVPSLSLLN